MKNNMTIIKKNRNTLNLKNLTVFLSATILLGLGLWIWIKQNPEILPNPNSTQGKSLLKEYLGTTYDVWLIMLALAISYLISKIYKSKYVESQAIQEHPKKPKQKIFAFISKNKTITIVLLIYAVAMIAGTTYLYKDMLGWYPELIKGHFLDNFSVRRTFIEETMRRSDYRFFPLAHQDLHILSWFTIHIKTWMLFNVAELVGVLALSLRFLNNLEPDKQNRQSTVLLVTLLLLINPSTATTFFHVIYCERLLCLLFLLYITSYAEYIKKQKKSAFYLTLLWASIGIFVKDIAIILFAVPAASIWTADIAGNSRWLKKQADKKFTLPVDKQHRLEKWIGILTLVFLLSYIVLALIPSSYLSEGLYSKGFRGKMILDLRFYLLIIIAFIRFKQIAKGTINFTLLDGANLSAFAYAVALYSTNALDTTSYLSMPIQLIATINVGWLWINLFESKAAKNKRQGNKYAGSILAAVAIISADHATTKNTFIRNVSSIKAEQIRIQESYEKLEAVSKKIRESGDDLNIIIHKESNFSARRHLNRIPYKSLIVYDPKDDIFIVEDGAGKKKQYSLRVGDTIANIDQRIQTIDPILQKVETELIYKQNDSTHSGIILRVTAIK